MSGDDYTDLVIMVGVAAIGLYLLNKAGAFVQNVSNEITGATQAVSNLIP